MEQFSIVGRRIPRVDGLGLVEGNGLFTTDIVLPRMLYGKVLRSNHPHARILSIDTEKAKRLPGVKAVITGKDTAGKLFGLYADEQAIAVDKVRYIGEAVAAVAATDEDIAEEALSLIRVEYEPLPAVFDAVEAMQPGAPLVHEELGTNVSAKPEICAGDVERGFAESDYIREDEFTTGIQFHSAMEPHGAIAQFDADGKLTVWASTQGPFSIASDLALTLEMPLGNVRVIKPRVGGGFGGKRDLMACHFAAALLARQTGCPVKIIYTREEVFCSTRTRHPMIIRVKTGVKKDGTFVAREGTIVANGGAYNSRGPMIVKIGGAEFAGPYRIPNMKFTGYHVYTNYPAGGPFRGYGLLQCRFAVESQIDMIAEELGLDPVEIRLKNAVGPNEKTCIGWRITSCGLTECVHEVVEASGWKERRGNMPKNHGLGIACNDYPTSVDIFGFKDAGTAYVRLQDDGTVVVFSGASDIGQGSDTTLCQIVAEELGISMDKVQIVSADTQMAPRDLGSYASRVTFIAGNAAKLAAADAKKQLFQVAGELLEASPNDLEVRNERIYVKGSPDRSVGFAETTVQAMRYRGIFIQGHGDFTAVVDNDDAAFNVSSTYSFGAQVAEVEVDVETGQVKVHKFWASHDCGRAINPMSIEGQEEGSIVCGTGHALYESRHIDESGRMLTPSFLDYRIPTSLEAPDIEAHLVETIDPIGPFGAKGVSEGAQVPVAPAIANAIYDAIGVRIKDMPITPDSILRALEEKRRKESNDSVNSKQ